MSNTDDFMGILMLLSILFPPLILIWGPYALLTRGDRPQYSDSGHWSEGMSDKEYYDEIYRQNRAYRAAELESGRPVDVTTGHTD